MVGKERLIFLEEGIVSSKHRGSKHQGPGTRWKVDKTGIEHSSVRAESLENGESKEQIMEHVRCAETLGFSLKPLGALQGFEQVLPLLHPCFLSAASVPDRCSSFSSTGLQDCTEAG